MPAIPLTLLVGTTKRAFLVAADADRQTWDISGPHCGGWCINHMAGDPRTGTIWAGGGGDFFGAGVWRSDDQGQNWDLTRLSKGQMDDWAAQDPDFAAMVGWTDTPCPSPPSSSRSGRSASRMTRSMPAPSPPTCSRARIAASHGRASMPSPITTPPRTGTRAPRASCCTASFSTRTRLKSNGSAFPPPVSSPPRMAAGHGSAATACRMPRPAGTMTTPPRRATAKPAIAFTISSGPTATPTCSTSRTITVSGAPLMAGAVGTISPRPAFHLRLSDPRPPARSAHHLDPTAQWRHGGPLPARCGLRRLALS